MMKYYLLFCLLALTLHIPAFADGAKTQLVVWTKDGVHVAFALDERPQVTFTETELVITTKEAHHYALENMAKFTYEQIPDGIKSLLADDAAFTLDGESLLFPSLKAGSTVSLTSLNGTSIFKKTVKSDGEYAFPLVHLNDGVYLVTVNGLTFKIVKR
ncbi:MAG: T9SS type A sorting domain-containing protein [Prevotella sp.]|nr:T9SS type A sorting domain-containing protein [Prevotella sp.]